LCFFRGHENYVICSTLATGIRFLKMLPEKTEKNLDNSPHVVKMFSLSWKGLASIQNDFSKDFLTGEFAVLRHFAFKKNFLSRTFMQGGAYSYF
jgi:hypothetical protein